MHVVIELKGLKSDLDLRQNRKQDKRTPVDQGFSYAHKYRDTQWVIVSNYRELRLYHQSSSHYALHFDLTTITNPENQERLQLLLHLLVAENMLPGNDDEFSTTDEIYANRKQELKQISDAFYGFYNGLRREVYDYIRKTHNASPPQATALAQKLMDRILFIAFLEDNGLVPPDMITRASTVDPFAPQPIWSRYLTMFKAVESGNELLGIPAYGGKLYTKDKVFDKLNLPDALIQKFTRFAAYDFAADLRVNILGNVFEKSVSDLSVLQEGKDRRHDEGAYFTPDIITEYIVDDVLEKQLSDIRQKLGEDDLPALSPKTKKQHIAFWQTYLARLQKLRILDPSCGAGAFLVAAFDYLEAEGVRVRGELAQLGVAVDEAGWRYRIITNNLFGVDLSPEAVEITSLSLWLKMADSKQKLTSLERNLKHGNAAVDFDWRKTFPQVMKEGGFDIVLGNPPYVRHELIKGIKPQLKQQYETYHGRADLLVYFIELGHKLLKPNGRLGYITSNKFHRTAYGEPLRRFLSTKTQLETVMDLTHRPDIFPDATVDVAILSFKKTASVHEEITVEAHPFYDDKRVISSNRLDAENWNLAPKEEIAFIEQMKRNSIPLHQWPNVQINGGFVTGFNEAFFIDEEKRDELISADPTSAAIIKPLLRGRDIKPWHINDTHLWLIFTRRGIDIDHYPAVKAHLQQYYNRLRPRNNNETTGRKAGSYRWYEIQDTVAYYENFERPKIIYPEINSGAIFALDHQIHFYHDTTVHHIVGDDLYYLLAVLNSDTMEQYLYHTVGLLGKDSLHLKEIHMRDVPIPKATPQQKAEIERATKQLIKLYEKQASDQNIKSQIEKLEASLNDLVNKLYGIL